MRRRPAGFIRAFCLAGAFWTGAAAAGPEKPICGVPFLDSLLSQRGATIPGTPRRAGQEARLTPRRGDALCDSSLDTPHFRVHFAPLGEAAPRGWPSPEYVEVAAAALEHAYTTYSAQMGLPLPLTDGTRGGGENLYDCYLLPVPEAWGVSIPEEADSAGCPHGSTGYLEIVNDLESEDWRVSLRGLLAHEYFHLTHFALNVSPGVWFVESTATWAARQDVPEDPISLQDMRSWFLTPYLSLWEGGLSRAYGSSHFWAFLEAGIRQGLVARVWLRCCGTDWKTALSRELEDEGFTLDDALEGFTVYNAVTGTRDDGEHYPDGALYPDVSCQALHSAYPVSRAAVPEHLLARAAGSNYLRFLSRGAADTLSFHLDGRPELAGLRRISFVATRLPNHHRFRALAPDDSGDVAFLLPDWTAYDELTVVVANFEGAVDDREFLYSAEERGIHAPPGIAALRCVPNPFRQDAELRFTLAGSRSRGRIEIYDLLGRRIWESLPLDLLPGEISLPWGGTGAEGDRLPAGVYFVRIRIQGAEETVRLSIVR